MPDLPTIPNQLIRASAGTGKTYQLSSRYLRLLFLTEAPQRIIALTFTRKAAGEFFEKIFNRLVDAASSKDAARELTRTLSLPSPVTQESALKLLRLLVDHLSSLQLSTYDSFFSRIVQTFPFDLGLSSTPTSLDERQQAEAVQRTQRSLSRHIRHDEELMNEFWHAFKRATMGGEAKTMTRLLTSFIDEHHALYFQAPHAEQWGQASTIWPQGCPWISALDKGSAAERVRAFRDEIPFSELTPRQADLWEDFLKDLGEWEPPAPAKTKLLKFVVKFLEVYDELESGDAVITVQRKQTLPPALGALAKELSKLVFWNELSRRLESTQGIFRIIQIFESIYSEEVRRVGLLTIDDMTNLLAGNAALPDGIQSPANRQLLDYRLNTSYDHWLLDEFQDTSTKQWLAIENLIDEVMQDESGQRSFFAVGDAKQSLYMWRGSDDRLFDNLHKTYGQRLSLDTLDVSYRSVPPILDMVNGIFGRSDVLENFFGESLAERWTKAWVHHQAADSLEKKSGHSALIHAPEEDEENRESLLALIQGLDPLPRGLSVAVLVRENREAEEIIDLLRSRQIPCSLAANTSPGADNAASTALISLFTLAAHPSDSLAWQHILMTPPGKRIAEKYPSPALLSARLLDLAANKGLKSLVEFWIGHCIPFVPATDLFTLDRLEQCRNAAAILDAQGGNTTDTLAEHLRTMTVREHDTPGQVAVMTIHKAKGLDWDIIILPNLEGKSLDSRRRQIAVQKNRYSGIDWILDMPNAELASRDPVLNRNIEQAREDAAYEQLCLLYVALTRARRGLYVITKAAKERSSSLNFPKLLESTLVDSEQQSISIGAQLFTAAWQSGRADWISELPPPAAKEQAGRHLPILPPEKRRTHPRPIPSVPTSLPPGNLTAFSAFSPQGSSEKGNTLHAILEQIEWLPEDAERRSENIQKLLQDSPENITSILKGIFENPRTLSIFQKPQGIVELWREIPFEVLHKNVWMSGRFDRVHIHKNASGRIEKVLLLDFKTTDITDDAILLERYRPQMESYRNAIGILLGTSPEMLKMQILATAPPRLITL